MAFLKYNYIINLSFGEITSVKKQPININTCEKNEIIVDSSFLNIFLRIKKSLFIYFQYEILVIPYFLNTNTIVSIMSNRLD